VTPSRRRSPVPRAAVRYTVSVHSAHAHLFAITLRVQSPAKNQRVSLPVWIPGSYLVREFSQHLQNLCAWQGGQPTTLKQLDKHRWQVQCDAGAPLELRYEVYAFDPSVRTAFLDATRGFFNATSLCLQVPGQEDQPHALELEAGPETADWQVATGLAPHRVDANGFGQYLARDYDELADCPVEMGRFWSGQFTAAGVEHRFVVSGAGVWMDGARLLEDARRVCETQIAFWHGKAGEKPPFARYVFMLYASGDGYGGLEHRNSTALICQRSGLPRQRAPGEKPAPLKATDGYTTLLGLISHEYFHTWNVKRLRPAEFARYDYNAENHTELLWFFEGFTSYYDDLMLRRAGLIDEACYLQLVAKTLNQVRQTPGRLVQTVAQASFDAWVKYYRVGENTPNATVSYYTKGALVALCLDLTLRAEGHSSLDAVMRELWQRRKGGPMREADVLSALKRLGRRSFEGDDRLGAQHGRVAIALPVAGRRRKSDARESATGPATGPARGRGQWQRRAQDRAARRRGRGRRHGAWRRMAGHRNAGCPARRRARGLAHSQAGRSGRTARPANAFDGPRFARPAPAALSAGLANRNADGSARGGRRGASGPLASGLNRFRTVAIVPPVPGRSAAGWKGP